MPRKCGNEDAPVERSEANGFLPRMPDSLEQLDLLLIQVAKEREVRVKGISFQRLRYISTTLTTNATYRIVTTRAGDYTALNLPAGSLEFKFNGGSLLAKETLVLHSRFC